MVRIYVKQVALFQTNMQDLHVLSCFFPAGLFFVYQKYEYDLTVALIALTFESRVTNERVFLILYAISSVYFAGVMVCCEIYKLVCAA